MSGRIAVNVADLTRNPAFVTEVLLGPVTPSRLTVGAELDRVDGIALVLEADDARARAIVEILRVKDSRMGRYSTRAYVEGTRGGWAKLPMNGKDVDGCSTRINS
jgi:hypothetical protein